MIGPTIGHELKRKGILAAFYALIAILIYVAWRFEVVFAVTSVIALFHDALITIGMMMVTGREFSLPVIAAILTVIGYSINDTIVVFDRIRENMRAFFGKKPFVELVNESINQTLSRTIITSLTTFFVVLCLFLFGGGVINDFSFALLVGIVVGTYSSIFIASSLVVDWYKIKKAK
jgi:preprotein translocase subunit SecF